MSIPKTKNVSVSSELLTMEDLCQIFPLVSQIVLNNLDDQSLANCKIASRELKEFLEDEKLLSIRIIKKYQKNLELFSDSWKKAIQNTPRDCQGIGNCRWWIFQSMPIKVWRAKVSTSHSSRTGTFGSWSTYYQKNWGQKSCTKWWMVCTCLLYTSDAADE